MSLIDITPIMTSNTAPSPYVVSTSGVNGSYSAWKAFNGTCSDSSDAWISANTIATSQKPHWIKIDLGENKLSNIVKITQRNASPPSSLPYPPEEFKIEGSIDDVSYDVLKEIVITSWENNEEKTFEFPNSKGYRYYRISVSKCLNKSYNFVSFGEIRFCYDSTIVEQKKIKNKFKSPISVDGFIELSNSVTIPQTPNVGDMKIFAINNKIYQMNDTGECSEIGGSNTSGGTTQMTMDILFEGMADTTGEYTMLKNIDEYNYLISSYEVKPKGLISIIPKMSSNTQGDYLASASSQQRPAYSAFNGVTGINDNVWYSSEIDPPHWVAITNSVEMTINAFSITNGDATSDYGAYAPKIFTLQGSNDGIDYVDIKTFTLTQFNASEEKIFMLDGKVSFKSYRLYITAGFSTSYKAVIVGEFKLGLLENDGFDRIINKYSYGRNIIENYNSKEYISKYDLNKLNFQTDGNAFITRVVGIK